MEIAARPPIPITDLPPADQPLARTISSSETLGDPSIDSLSSIEMRRALQEHERFSEDSGSLRRLAHRFGLSHPADLEARVTNVFGPPRPDRKTRIVNTIGPKSSDPAVIARMIKAGTDVVRINFSHIKTLDEARALVDAIHQAEEMAGRKVVILADLQGPKIRIGTLGDPIEAPTGSTLKLVPEGFVPTTMTDAITVPVAPPAILKDMDVGERMFIEDGKIEVRVTAKGADGVEVEVVRGGTIKSRKGLNLPDTVLSERIPTAKDRRDIAIIQELGIDTVAVSFVESGADMDAVRAAFNGPVKLLAKIERPQALDRLEEIYKASDAIMVARGDLAVEVGHENVPVIEKKLHDLSDELCVPTGTATQMLASMVTACEPLRAEASDVARSVFAGAAFVMTSEETAMGDDPVHVVETMNKLVVRTEQG